MSHSTHCGFSLPVPSIDFTCATNPGLRVSFGLTLEESSSVGVLQCIKVKRSLSQLFMAWFLPLVDVGQELVEMLQTDAIKALPRERSIDGPALIQGLIEANRLIIHGLTRL
jgi:hypothetical protein